MTRIAAREMVVHMVYSLDFTLDIEELVEVRLDHNFYQDLQEEDPIFLKPPDDVQKEYIRTLIHGIEQHLPELDGYIEKYSRGWKFGRLPRVAIAIMRVCMYETLYRPDIPNAASVNAAIEISKKYEPEEITSFINGILGTFVRKETLPLEGDGV